MELPVRSEPTKRDLSVQEVKQKDNMDNVWSFNAGRLPTPHVIWTCQLYVPVSFQPLAGTIADICFDMQLVHSHDRLPTDMTITLAPQALLESGYVQESTPSMYLGGRAMTVFSMLIGKLMDWTKEMSVLIGFEFDFNAFDSSATQSLTFSYNVTVRLTSDGASKASDQQQLICKSCQGVAEIVPSRPSSPGIPFYGGVDPGYISNGDFVFVLPDGSELPSRPPIN